MPRPISTKTPLGLLRSKLQISAAKMAKRVGLGTSTLQKIEQGTFAMTEGVAQKISHEYLVDTQWLLRGKASEGIKGITDHPWTKDSVDAMRLRLGAQMDNDTRKVAVRKAEVILKLFAEVLKTSIADGNCWQVMIDAHMALDEIVRTYYPNLHGEWHTTAIEHGLARQPKEKRSSRKPRKRA